MTEQTIFVVYHNLKMRVLKSIADELGLRNGQTIDYSIVKKIVALKEQYHQEEI